MKNASYVLYVLLLHPAFAQAQLQNNGNLRMHSGSEIGLFGDFSNNGNFSDNLGSLHIVGSNLQAFNGNNLIQVNNLIINKTNNSLQLDNILEIAGLLTFNTGHIATDRADVATEFVNFLDNATYTGENDASHIDGVIRKTGNDAFVFPTGNNSILRPIGISAPSLVTDHFTAYYSDDDPDGLYSNSSLDVDLHHISECEYWILNRTAGSSIAIVTLSWDSNSCGVDNLCDLVVARWDGSKWVSEGNGGITGNTTAGTLESGTDCTTPAAVSNFSPFTLASLSSDNPLPVSIISFKAEVCQESVCIEWETETETNNDFFTVEKSADTLNWKPVETVDGTGNSKSTRSYRVIDKSPFIGKSYYRLKQTDIGGKFEYVAIVSVDFEGQIRKEMILYPNPANDKITIEAGVAEIGQLKIYNVQGQEVTSSVKVIKRSKLSIEIDVSTLQAGKYHAKIDNLYSSFIKE